MATVEPVNSPEQLFVGFRIACMRPDSLGDYDLLDKHTIGVSAGIIDWVLPESSIPRFDENVKLIQGNGELITPGLIDCHTHLVYGGNRAIEWSRRLAGQTYESLAAEGGGILSTVNATRMADEDQLLASAKQRLACLLREGVTTVEIKSGYGLDLDTELKMLRVARELENQLAVEVESTLLAAHTCPSEFAGRNDDYIDLVCNQIIPASRRICSAVDVFCDQIAFNLDQSRRVLETATELGLRTKIHAEQLTHTGAAVMAAQLGALSADHLEYLSQSDCEILAECGTVATLLPGAFYCLQETQKPPISTLLQHHVPIAIATDSNPGSSPLLSLRLAANMACNLFGLLPEQAFAGITCNAARALGIHDTRGSIEIGKQADFAVWSVESLAEILYTLGDQPCVNVFKRGELVL